MRIVMRAPVALLGGLLIALVAVSAEARSPAKGRKPPGAENLPAPTAQSVTRSLTATVGYSCPFCDLRGADMAGRNLADANLQGADLEDANLKGADLSGAVLAGANLANANLEGARLNRSAKGRADLSGANLAGTILRGASLDGTDLQYADLSQTDLNGVDLGHAVSSPKPGTSNAPWTCGRADVATLRARVHVATTGTDIDTCGADPGNTCATIGKGIARCAGVQGCGVLVAWGTYKPAATIALADGINVYGGCTPAPRGEPLQSLIEAPAGGQPAMSASKISNRGAILQGFRLQGSAAPAGAGTASVAFAASDSPKLTVLDTRILAGPGANGRTGQNGNAGAAGVAGSGATGSTQGACGGANGGNGSVVMGVYLTGGETSFTCHPTCSDNACWGYPGSVAGGQWGNGHCKWCARDRGQTGRNGGDGPNATRCGVKGNVSANAAGSFSGTTWQASAGGNGGGGATGGGGGGGGAGGYRAGYCFGQEKWQGNRGGGGGSGGCPASGGTGGQQGGASLAVTLFATPLVLTNTAIVGGRGGNGGNGGAGASGGNRSAGAGGLTGDGGGYGGNGGTGGAGAASGGGAGGNGGPAIGIALAGGSRVTGSGNIFYVGASGAAGTSGTGGTPIVAGLCAGGNGDSGRAGMVADQQTY